MSIPEKDYEFVGGSMDGQVKRMSGTWTPGMEFPGTLPGVAGRRPIYVLDRDNRFRFDRLGLGLNSRAEMTDAVAEITPILEKVAEQLSELDAVFEKYGGPSAGNYNVGNWVLRHKDA